jgi:hypothetical protein
MRSLARLARAAAPLAVALLAAAPAARADQFSTGFEDYAVGTLSGANNAHLGADGRLPGAADGPRRWWTPGNAVTDGEVVSGIAHSGSKSLAIVRRNNNNDGVIVGIASPRLPSVAGERVAPVNAAFNTFRFSYWFRTASNAPVPNFRFGAEAWGPVAGSSDRYTWHRFIADGSGNLSLYSVGMVNDASLDYFPVNDTLVASGLSWGAWYRVETTVQFADGGDDNDAVFTRIYDASNALVGSATDTTWETGFRYALFYPTTIFGVDSVNLVARCGGDSYCGVTGPVAYVDDFAMETLAGQVSLATTNACDQDHNIDVAINLNGASQNVVGGQFFLQYDKTRLTYTGATPAPGFPQTVYSTSGSLSPSVGTIDLAVGVSGNGPGTAGPALMATLHFTINTDVCASQNLTLVSFRPRAQNAPPTRLTGSLGEALNTAATDLAPFTVDTQAPTLNLPANIVRNADAGLCSALVTVPAATATDNCTPSNAIAINVVRLDNQPLSAPYPVGVTTLKWTATDSCGNSSMGTRTVTILPLNTVNVTVQLEGISSGTLTRCVAFDFYAVGTCPNPTVSVNVPLTFVNGVATGQVNVLCGQYTCATARDPRHTLRSTDSAMTTSMAQYAADFTGTRKLIGGNLNDDGYIDILDFGVFVGAYGTFPGANTTCGTPFPHADISGDGLVGSADYTYIQSHFLQASQLNCCGNLFRPAPPIEAISRAQLRARGLADLIRADLNNDGVLDARDMDWFALHGATPCPGDFNRDASADVTDIFAFLTAWFAGDDRADVNLTNGVELTDIFSFLNAWFRGC